MKSIKIIKKILSFIACAILLSVFLGTATAAHGSNDLNDSNPAIFDKAKENKKYIALTFDDGPHPVYTQKILDILEEKKVSATFFVVGYRAELLPETLKRMKDLDCEIGNPTHNHTNLSGYVKNGATHEIEKCSEAIFAATGEYPVIYRPPFGKISKENEKRIPLKKILWTVDSLDWDTKNKDRVVRNVVKNVKDGSIILMHDFYESTLKALPEIIDILSDEGYEFATVSELAALKKISRLQEYFLD